MRAVRKRTRVCAERDLYARGEGLLETWFVNARAGGLAPSHGQVFLRLEFVDVQRRHQVDAPGDHLLDGGVVEVQAVLDGIHSAVEASVQPRPAVSVAGHLDAFAMRFVHDGLDFLQRERGNAYQLARAGEIEKASNVELYPLG